MRFAKSSARFAKSSAHSLHALAVIRPARADELPALRAIEVAAGQLFAAIEMTRIAEEEPFTLGELRRHHREGRVWVAVDAADRPVAYLIADVVDGNAHVEQVSVHPDHARRGVGR